MANLTSVAGGTKESICIEDRHKYNCHMVVKGINLN